MLDTLKKIQKYPGQTVIIHDFDGVYGNDALGDMFPELRNLHGEDYRKLDFWESFLKPYYDAREQGKEVSLDLAEKRTVMVDSGGRKPYIGDELLLLHHALIRGQEEGVIREVFERGAQACLVNTTAMNEIERLRDRFGKRIAVASGSFYECINDTLGFLRFDENDVHSTSAFYNSQDGKVFTLHDMVGSGGGKIEVLDDTMRNNNSKYGVIIDDGTTGINVAIEAATRDGCISICLNPSVTMMRNVPEAIFLATGDLEDINRILEGDLEPVPFSEWKKNPVYTSPLAVHVGLKDDIGVERTKHFIMPYGFVGYGPAEKGSLAEYMTKVRKSVTGELVPLSDIKTVWSS